MARRQTLYRQMKNAENAFKRSEFNPKDYWDERYAWFVIDVGQCFVIPGFEMNIQAVRNMACRRTKISGYEYSVKQIDRGARVTRIA